MHIIYKECVVAIGTLRIKVRYIEVIFFSTVLLGRDISYTAQELIYGIQRSDLDNSWQENMHLVVLPFPETCCKQEKEKKNST